MKPDVEHQGGRFQMLIEFDMPTIEPTRGDIRKFAKDALESMGGCRYPNDPMFNSLGQVTVKRIVKKNKSGFWIYVSGGGKNLRDTVQRLVKKFNSKQENL